MEYNRENNQKEVVFITGGAKGIGKAVVIKSPAGLRILTEVSLGVAGSVKKL